MNYEFRESLSELNDKILKKSWYSWNPFFFSLSPVQ